MISGTDSKGTFYILNKKSGIPIVLIHGVGLNHKMWEPQINSFNNTILSYDILGHGKTPMVKKGEISFDDFSKQLINLLNELEIKKIHLVGFSIGSLIARNFAEKFNDRLETLTLLCTVFQRNKKQQQIVNDRFELSKKSKSLSKQALKRWFTDDYLIKNPEIFEKITLILESNNIENFLKIYQLFVNHRDSEDFSKINANTLIITGEGDVGSTPEMSEKLSKVINNSKLKIIAKGKHLCNIECVDDVNKALRDHMNV